MKSLITFIKNKPQFSILFFAILLVDILVKTNLDLFYRYFTKPFVLLSLLLFLIFNYRSDHKLKYTFSVFALICFLLGDFLFINHSKSVLLLIAIGLFFVGKMAYCYVFLNKKDFNLSDVLPFSLMVFLYAMVLFYFIFENLKDFFFPVLIYLFATFLMILLSILRRREVNSKSYVTVLSGVVVFMFSESIMALDTFYKPFPFEDVLVMLAYGIAQYLIVTGIVMETSVNPD